MIDVGDLHTPQSMKEEIIKKQQVQEPQHKLKEVTSEKHTIYVYHDENENYTLHKDKKGKGK